MDLRAQLDAAIGLEYAVEREIGAGGMARVFAAVEVATGRRVAVKVLAPAVAACCDADRFRREMAVVAALDHPHIVPLLRECEVCGDGRLFYFVMPFIEGETLRGRLDREGTLPVDAVVRLLLEITSALAYAHGRGVVHRDIKPGNILLSEGRALVADFGIAKAVVASWQHVPSNPSDCETSCDPGSAAEAGVELTRAGLAVGTPIYMAPEQAVGDPETDHRTDLYALGVLAYEMLVGSPPFMARSLQALVAAHLTARAPSVLESRPDVPPALADLVAQLLKKSPEDRPRRAEVVLRALGARDSLRAVG